MTLGLVGRKVGMTRVFTDDGDSLPVTVLDVSDNRVTQIKTPATDGYSKFDLVDHFFVSQLLWQGQRASNPQPSVLETDALPIELCPCAFCFTR